MKQKYVNKVKLFNEHLNECLAKSKYKYKPKIDRKEYNKACKEFFEWLDSVKECFELMSNHKIRSVQVSVHPNENCFPKYFFNITNLNKFQEEYFSGDIRFVAYYANNGIIWLIFTW